MKRSSFSKICFIVQIGSHAFLNVDDTSLKLWSFLMLFSTLLMLSIWVYFILCWHRVSECLYLLKFLNTNNAYAITYFPPSNGTESHYRGSVPAGMVSTVMGNLVPLGDAQTKLVANKCRKHSHTVFPHLKMYQKFPIWTILNHKQMIPSKINCRPIWVK